MASEDRPQAPQSVTRVIGILDSLAASAVPVSLADLSRALATPKSSLAALLRGLAEEHFVEAIDGAWRLGPGAFGLGSALMEARRRFTSSDLVRAAMRRLAEQTGETALFAVRDGDGETMTYVDMIESRNAVRFAISIGDRRPLYATAGGRALLAAGSEADEAAYFARLSPRALTSATVTDKAELVAAVALARAVGVAQTVDQAGDGVTGTAAVIRDAAGLVLGALVVAAPSARMTGRREDLARLVMGEAVATSRSLGHRPGAL